MVTNLQATPASVYAGSCRRGDRESRLKALDEGFALERTRGLRCWANQFRVRRPAAASVLLQELRRRAPETTGADAHVSTRRACLLTLAVWVERAVRLIVLHRPRTAPWGATWRRLAVAVGATPG